MIDTLLAHRERARGSRVLEAFRLEPGRYAVLTLHRPANVDDKQALERVVSALLDVSAHFPILFPVHPRRWTW